MSGITRCSPRSPEPLEAPTSGEEGSIIELFDTDYVNVSPPTRVLLVTERSRSEEESPRKVSTYQVVSLANPGLQNPNMPGISPAERNTPSSKNGRSTEIPIELFTPIGEKKGDTPSHRSPSVNWKI